tara:strand:- start:749 stop:3367 length:2619 start_codon:yes stop_codon:yes gene_type:complete
MSTDPSQTKALKLVDLNLFSGSTDVFRSAVGGYFQINENEDTEDSSISFQDYDPNNPLTPYFAKIRSRGGLKETVSEEIIVLNKKFPVRVYGDGETVLNDKHWKVLFTGGQFSGETISSLYNENVYGYHYFESPVAYPRKDAAAIEGDAISDQIQISYDYNAYLPTYEAYVRSLDSELLIPNFYILSDLQSVENLEDINSDTYDSDIINFTTLNGAFPNVNTVLNYDFATYPAKIKNKLKTKSNRDYTILSTEYLPKYFVQNPLASSTRDAIKNKLKNIILDDAALQQFYVPDEVSQYAERFPYHMKINFSMDESSTFVDYITDNKYTTHFLKTIKEVFSGELRGLPPLENTYASNMNYLSSSEDTFVDYEVKTTENKNYRHVDFIQMLAYNYNNYLSKTDDCYFVGGRDIYRDSMFDLNGCYRYMNSISSVETMNNVIDYLNNESNFNINNLKDFLYQNNDPCYTETLAYRVQKVGGAPTGDARTQNTLQNYWFLNSKEVDEFNFVDTQVKYGRDYTYHVYKYVAVVGARYKFSDLRVTQAVSADNEIDQAGTTYYGLEFYDPKTDTKVEQLFNVGEARFETINPAGTLIQEKSESPYLADFYLNYEPCVHIYEVPIYSKTLKVMDSPPNGTNIYPYQHLDNSQKIGFGLYYNAFNKNTFPKIITSRDEKLKQDYMNGNDFLTDTKIPLESVTRPRYIEIYRINEKPTSYSDFNNSLIKTLDLRMKDSDETYTVDFFDDKIKTNTKYYYLFRMLNEHRMIGHTSEIYEAVLVNDGGYKYATFNVLYEQDLEKNIFVNPSKKLKKLIQLQPNMSQMTLNTDLMNFEKEAHTQIKKLRVGSAEDLIWDKTFKIRLTSKKTGKKVDLNITYKLN